MENKELEMLKEKLTEELEDVKSILENPRFKGLKEYFNGKYIGLRYALQEIEYALRKKGE